MLAALGGGVAQAADAGGAGGFLLIDGGAPAGQPRLTGCDRAMSDLHAALDKAGARNTVLIAPTAGGLREALLQFGTNGENTSNAVLFCGYAAEAGGNVFALGTDFSAHDDPALSAVSVRAFSRVSGGKNGLVLLDLHPMAVEGASLAAIAGALDGAAGAWSTDNSQPGTRIVATDRQPGDAGLIDRAARSGASTPAAIAQAVGQQPSPPSTQAAATTPPAPPADSSDGAKPAQTTAASPTRLAPPVETSKTPAAGSSTQSTGLAANPEQAPGGGATTTPAMAAASPATGAESGAPKAGPDEAGATELAPKPAAEAAAPRKRVHVDPMVRRVQVALLARGLFNGRVNGVNGPDTQNGIQHFQAMLGHPTTGQLTADETKQLTGG